MSSDLDQWGLSADFGASPDDDARLGRIVRVDRGECDVMTAAGVVRALSDSQRSQAEVAPVTGDWVEIIDDPGLGPVIADVRERRTKVSRRDPAERDTEQVLAANVDVVALVHGLDRPLPPGRLERLLVLGEDSGAEPVVVLTKSDLLADGDDTEAAARAVAGTVPVVATSLDDPSSFDPLRAMMGQGRTMALVGASGVGKSSIVNALSDDDVVDIGEVRAGDAKGRHTTTARELVRLPGDAGLVLDTPGIRSIGLWEADAALERVFGDLEELAASCRFNDCAHGSEPGCALRAAVDDGDADPLRVERYLALVAELASLREREEDRRRREGEGRNGRSRSKEQGRQRRQADDARRRKGRGRR